jgi:hypothetical protein
MTVGECVWKVAASGALGGLVACLHKDAVLWPQFDKVSKVWSPGALGNIFVGAFAAGVVWSLYSPSGLVDIAAAQIPALSLTMRELGSMALIGFSGGKVLTLLAQQEADKIAKRELQNCKNRLRPSLTLSENNYILKCCERN